MTSLPKGWSKSQFSQINEYASQVVNPKNASRQTFELFSVPAYPSNRPEVLKGAEIGSTKQTVRPGDVLVCKINPHLNRVWVVPESSGNAQLASSEWIVMRQPELDARYLGHYFRSRGFRELLQKDVTGVGGSLTRAQPKRVATFEIPLAPLAEQQRIADKLESLLARVDACRDRLDRIPGILKRFRQSVLAAATSGELTADWREERSFEFDWEQTTVGALLTDIRYGTARKCDYEPVDTPVVRIPNLVDGRIDQKDMKYASFDQAEKRKLGLQDGDILVIRSNGSLDLVGKTAVVSKSEEGFLYAGYLIRLRIVSGVALPRFVSLYLSSPEVRTVIETTARSTSGVNNINTEEIRGLSIAVPPIQEQEEIVRRVETLLTYADRLEANARKGLARLDSLTPSILAKAFRGELVPQDPNDEPVSDLLERILANREPGRVKHDSGSAKVTRSRKTATAQQPLLV